MITAIIPHYWDTRTKDLQRIVEALAGGTVTPSRVIIWNNTTMNVASAGVYVDVIGCGRNLGIAARFAAAYLAQTKYVFFQDNDLMVQGDTLFNMLKYAESGVSVELQGRMLGPNKGTRYSESEYRTNVDQFVDVGLSRMSLMTRETAVSLCSVIPPDVADDDLWTSRNVRVRLIPYGASEGFINLPEHEGLSSNVNGHIARRNRLVEELWR